MPQLPIIWSGELEPIIRRCKPVYTIDNPSALANALPTLLDMVKSGWVIETGSKEWTQYKGESLANLFSIVVVVNGTMTSILLHSDIDTVKRRARHHDELVERRHNIPNTNGRAILPRENNTSDCFNE
jgi:hypothetical protein